MYRNSLSFLDRCDYWEKNVNLSNWSVLALASIVITISSCAPDEVQSVVQSAQPVKIQKVSDGISESVRSFPASVAASETANIASKVAGQVNNIHVQPGDDVKTGDIILEIDQTDYLLNLEQAQANFSLANVSFKRIESSRKQNIATQAEYDNAKANFDLAKVGLQQAKNQLNDTMIRAPFSGVVVRVTPKQWDFVGAAQPLISVQSQNDIDVKFQVPSDIVARINEETADRVAVVSFDAFPGKMFNAAVKEFSSDSDRSTRSFDVTLTLKSPSSTLGNLLPGMDATVYIDMAKIDKKSELTVPSHAVFKRSGLEYVWVVTNEKAIQTQVTLGSVSGSQVAILEGLNSGDAVVIAGVHKLVDQQDILIWTGE